MTTDRRRHANRRNAQRSTGPKTPAGKARSSQNARKHGLSIPVHVQPQFADLMRDLAASLDDTTTPLPEPGEIQELAAAMLEVSRVRSIRAQILVELADCCGGSALGRSTARGEGVEDLLQYLRRAERYERRALSRRKFLIRSVSETSLASEHHSD